MYIRFWCFFLRFAVGGGVGRLGKRLAKPKEKQHWPPIRGRHGSNIQLGHRITAHGHGPQWSTKGLGPYALPQEIKMHGIGEDDDTPRLDIRAEGEKMDQVGEFCYLGTVISTDGRCSAAIDDRTRKAWV